LQIEFKHYSIGLTLLITGVLLIAIGSLFWIPKPEEILTSLKSKEMLYSLKLSVFTASIATLLVTFFAIPIGYAIARFSFKGKSLTKIIIDLPIAFPELVLGLSLLLLFGNSPLGKILNLIGIKIVFTKLGIIVAQFFTALPYAVRITCASFQGVSVRYEVVSRTLGYNELETFFFITLPMAKNGIIASIIITFARCIGAFGAVLILAGGSYMYTEILPITLYLNISYGNLGMAITSGIILILVSFVAITIFEICEKGNVY